MEGGREWRAFLTLAVSLLAAPAWAEGPFYVDGFDYPVGAPDAYGYGILGWDYLEWEAYYNVYHTGEDWNGLGGGNTDWGDPVYAIANGTIVAAGDYGPGWGGIIVAKHVFPDGSVVYSRYAHEDEIFVVAGQEVERGEIIGTIGRGYQYSDGSYDYYAHLHFDVLLEWQPPTAWVSGWSWSEVADVYADPSGFIEEYRVVDLPVCEQPEKIDVVYPRNKTTHTFVRVMPSDGTQFLPPASGQTVTTMVGLWYAGNFNDDRFTDLALVQRMNATTYTWYVFLNSGTGVFVAGSQWVADFGNDGDRFLIGDFSGDGMDDVAIIRPLSTGQVKICVRPSWGDVFGDMKWWTSAYGSSQGEFLAGDVDGDGFDDLVMALPRSATVLEYQVLKSTGTSFLSKGVWIPDNGSAGDFSQLGDYNGDGFVDVATGKKLSSTSIQWKIALSTGSKFNTGIVWKNDFGSGTATFYTGDVNGDGLDDLIYSDPRASAPLWRVMLSNGTTFGNVTTWAEEFGLNTGSFLTGEFVR